MPASDTGQRKSALIEDKKGAHTALHINDRRRDGRPRRSSDALWCGNGRSQCVAHRGRAACAAAAAAVTAARNAAHLVDRLPLPGAFLFACAAFDTPLDARRRNWAAALNRAPTVSLRHSAHFSAASTDRRSAAVPVIHLTNPPPPPPLAASLKAATRTQPAVRWECAPTKKLSTFSSVVATETR
uniref:Uncharacterized protein n=1 Tax=Plectus sambesii TaxID=2011161 RepID=A0A914V9H6_9BILA